MSSSYTYIENSRLEQLERNATRSYQSDAELQRVRRNAEQREANIRLTYQANLDSLNKRIASISDKHNAEIRQVSEDFRSSIARQTAEFNGKYEEIDNRVTTMAADFSEKFDSLARAQASRKDRAEITIAELDDLLITIRELNPDKFVPGDYNDLADQLNRAKSCLSQGDYEAALAITNVSLTKAARLLHRVSLLNVHFNNALTRAWEQANIINKAIGELTSGKPAHEFDIKDANGEITHYTLPYEINYWTKGQFAKIQSQSEEINKILENAENDLSVGIQEIESIYGELTTLYSSDDGEETGDIVDLDKYGRSAQIRSFAIGEMAIEVDNKLCERGWKLVDSGRIDGEDREPYSMLYEDGVGNRVALFVNSGEEEMGAGVDVEVFMKDEEMTGSTYSRGIKDGVEMAIDGLIGPNNPSRRERRNDCHKNTSPEVFIKALAQEAAQHREKLNKLKEVSLHL